MRRKPKYLRHYEKILLELKPFIESIREVPHHNKANLKLIIVAAFMKYYDYNLYNAQSKEYDDAFYKLGSLRSLCEDLISISYLMSLPAKKRNEHIRYLLNFYMYKSIIVQEDFFEENHPEQIVVPSAVIPKTQINFVKNKPNNSEKARKTGHADLPTVYKMAEETNLISLYRYMYYATSSIVHFRPDVLFKTGWGVFDENRNLSSVTFSFRHYHKYYHSFNTFYSWYLLKLQYQAFKRYLKIPKSEFNIIKDFDAKLINSDWPEITTFDHINMKGPSEWDRLMRRMMVKFIEDENANKADNK